MKLRRALSDFLRIVAEEAEKNPSFEQRLCAALGIETKMNPPKAAASEVQRPKNRRAQPVLNPIEVARSGESQLRTKLASLPIEQLKDIVAEYGMDPGKLVIKWKAPEKIIDRIIDISMARAQKGDAFRADPNRNDGAHRQDSQEVIVIEYKSYQIEPFEQRPGAWFARIRRKDGKKIKVSIDDSEKTELVTGATRYSRDDAVAEAKNAIDGGGME